uniref:probable mannitol dehydrogenase n=1 Tax=Fragaria vesca subsp. vesca TaxID=101020 RepID=UPI0005C943B6|nr:PREDICTED: probable mannitol dehydrogenase [Fragaria vesca subsp. vesca]
MSEATISFAEEVQAYGWAARDSSGILSPFHFTRRTNGGNDITMKILYCGICHSDLHLAKNEVGTSRYPLLPRHEIVGEVTKVGSSVTKFKVGDKAGVGCMLVVEEHFAVRIPDNLPLAGVAPMLCAGITVYSPMKHFGLFEHGKHLGVIGLGGLGHMAVKFAKAVGAKVTVISTSPNKKKEAIEQLGVDEFLISGDQQQLQTDGKLILVGAPLIPPELPVFPSIMGRKLIAGSKFGGMKETQETIDFAAKHNITADVEVIPMDYVNTAFERVAKVDVKYRFVINVENTLNSP